MNVFRVGLSRARKVLGDGSRFVERVLTTVATCRQQSRDLLTFLANAIQVERVKGRPPSLPAATVGHLNSFRQRRERYWLQ
ncbi:hypothetical protein R5W24_004357 [Gemmata sp. JC717]|uniref:hypothetical protein n=1 Tax=Gemmata algarum TaxID=2975278 RepID=UPI0021BB69F0|nr:hypothetical protein [Gemmata algarum]MDY3555218.1 hypothetical protein [Gemmata algarum]